VRRHCPLLAVGVLTLAVGCGTESRNFDNSGAGAFGRGEGGANSENSNTGGRCSTRWSGCIWTSTDAGMLLDVTLADLGADITSWSLTHLVDITEDGTVLVGYGINPSGAEQGYVVHLEATGIGGL
jgi:hypothetical protein